MAEKKKNTPKKKIYTEAIGRRREATARVRFYPAKKTSVTIRNEQYKAGDMIINGKRIQEYFPGVVNQKTYMAPLRATNTGSDFVISAQTRGGGIQGQLDAFVHGVSRALDKIDSEQYHTILKKRGFLTRDPRMKERRKAGLAQAARAKKQSPKR